MKRYKVMAVTFVMTTTLVTSSLSFAQGAESKAKSLVETQVKKTAKKDQHFKTYPMKKTFLTYKKETKINVDLLKELQNKKAAVEQELSDGLISESQASRMTSHIDLKIKEIETFNSMSPQEKKNKLLEDFTLRIGKFVKSGGLEKDTGDKKIEDYKLKLEKWNGEGAFPMKDKEDRGRKNE